ncbi:MAG: adaptor protein MecA [Lachnospiraceae bacterium]|nr:adaptor protein MecA [Lachnospiraceae bacterium]
MKIEKVNDHQIRCTLTKADLAERNLKLSELAYGTEKAKALFRDMLKEASRMFGFEADDIPLMIEAIPLPGGTIVLIITKVEDPDELDTRFSKFAPDLKDDLPEETEPIALSGSEQDNNTSAHLYRFESLDDAIKASHQVLYRSSVNSTLYKNDGAYYLMIGNNGDTAKYNKVTNTLTEYASSEQVNPSRLLFFKNKAETLIAEDALNNLSKI